MPNITVTNPAGETRQVDAENGLSLMESLRDLGYEDILALCGGCCSCATCHVHVDDQACRSLEPIDEDEQMMLENVDYYDAKLSRLSCQIELEDEHEGLHVTILNTF